MADDVPPPLQLAPGDLCHHGPNALPLYRVIWIDGGKAWLRDVNTDADAVVDLDRCRTCWTEKDGWLDPEMDPPPMPAPVRWPDGTPRT
jgi:hypothetical protein